MNKKKFLMKIFNNQKNVNFSNFVTLIKAFNFISTSSKGSHFVYKHDNIPNALNVQNKNGEAKPYQVKQFLTMIENYNLKLEDENE